MNTETFAGYDLSNIDDIEDFDGELVLLEEDDADDDDTSLFGGLRASSKSTATLDKAGDDGEIGNAGHNPLKFLAIAMGVALAIALLLGGAFAVRSLMGSKISSANRLLIGAESALGSSVSIPVKPEKVLGRKSNEELLAMRQRAVNRHPEFVASGYLPRAQNFAGLMDQGEWLGTIARFGSSTGKDPAASPSAASRVLLNPLLLVSADVWPVDPEYQRLGLDPHAPSSSRLRGYQTGQTYVPFRCKPSDVIWEPQNGKAIVSYNVGEFLHQRRKLDKDNFVLTTVADIELDMFNARDLNFDYCFTSPQKLQEH